MLPCLALSIIRWGSRIKWSNPGNGVAPSPQPRFKSYWKASLRVTLDGHQLNFKILVSLAFDADSSFYMLHQHDDKLFFSHFRTSSFCIILLCPGIFWAFLLSLISFDLFLSDMAPFFFFIHLVSCVFHYYLNSLRVFLFHSFGFLCVSLLFKFFESFSFSFIWFPVCFPII